MTLLPLIDFKEDVQSLILKIKEDRKYLYQFDTPIELQQIKEKLKITENVFDQNFIYTNDGATISNMRSLVVDRLIEYIIEILQKDIKLDQSQLVVVARGGYGEGHIFLNSDIDITVLHRSKNYQEAEYIYHLLTRILIDSLSKIQVAPIINTIDESRKIWNEDLISLISNSFSRYICGNEELYLEFNKNLVEHMENVSLKKITEEIHEILTKKSIDFNLSKAINIKYCAGGIIEIMMLKFVNKLLSKKNALIYFNKEINTKLNLVFHFFMCLRESVYRTNKTFFISNEDINSVARLMAKQGLCDNSVDSFIEKLTKNRNLIRKWLFQIDQFLKNSYQ